jgi:TIR domain
MPSPRFQHGFEHDIFVSYTHTDDQPDGGRRWVTEFMRDLEARLEIVSGHSVGVWRDETELGAADRFNKTIAAAVRNSALLLVVLSPSYFASDYCLREREVFYEKIRAEGKESVGTKSRVVKVSKFRVDLEKYPPDLRELLEYKFFIEGANSGFCREFHLSDDAVVRARYQTRVDDVAQEIAQLLSLLEPRTASSASKGSVYLADTTSDLEPQRDELRRHLTQLGFDVRPSGELRLLPTRNLRDAVARFLAECRLAIHPIGAYYGAIPEAEDKSIVQIQLELARATARNGDLPKIIWLPEGTVPADERQREFLNRIRTEFAGRGFEFLERPYRAMAATVEDRLKAPERAAGGDVPPSSGIYLVCANKDRSVAKTLRSFLFNQRWQVEWTPVSLNSEDLASNPEHLKLMRRNNMHLVLHGDTDDGWIQDRIRELNERRERGHVRSQAIYLANPRRDDKDDILVRDVELLEAYANVPVADVLKRYLDDLSASPYGQEPPNAAGQVAGGSV